MLCQAAQPVKKKERNKTSPTIPWMTLFAMGGES
jgi:hypothetical protein